jgi:hypothetical protein
LDQANPIKRPNKFNVIIYGISTVHRIIHIGFKFDISNINLKISQNYCRRAAITRAVKESLTCCVDLPQSFQGYIPRLYWNHLYKELNTSASNYSEILFMVSILNYYIISNIKKNAIITFFLVLPIPSSLNDAAIVSATFFLDNCTLKIFSLESSSPKIGTAW